MKVLMVCLGNICRSPLAEGILQHKINTFNLDWEVQSAGTGNWHIGELPDSRSILTAQKHGIDITHQRGAQLKYSDLEEYDLIFAMDSSNYQNILRLAVRDEQRKKVHLIMNMIEPKENRSVPDPYWNDDGFELVYEMLDKACNAIIQKYGDDGIINTSSSNQSDSSH